MLVVFLDSLDAAATRLTWVGEYFNIRIQAPVYLLPVLNLHALLFVHLHRSVFPTIPSFLLLLRHPSMACHTLFFCPLLFDTLMGLLKGGNGCFGGGRKVLLAFRAPVSQGVVSAKVLASRCLRVSRADQGICT